MFVFLFNCIGVNSWAYWFFSVWEFHLYSFVFHNLLFDKLVPSKTRKLYSLKGNLAFSSEMQEITMSHPGWKFTIVQHSRLPWRRDAPCIFETSLRRITSFFSSPHIITLLSDKMITSQEVNQSFRECVQNFVAKPAPYPHSYINVRQGASSQILWGGGPQIGEKQLICLEGKLMTPQYGNTFLFLCSQQLNACDKLQARCKLQTSKNNLADFSMC